MLILYIYNKTGGDISDYDYEVMINTRQITRGEVKKHKRSDGWAKLVRRVANQNKGGADNDNGGV